MIRTSVQSLQCSKVKEHCNSETTTTITVQEGHYRLHYQVRESVMEEHRPSIHTEGFEKKVGNVFHCCETFTLQCALCKRKLIERWSATRMRFRIVNVL